MFRTDQYGLVTVEGPLEYGHETLVIGRTPNFRRLGPAVEIVNSWGLDNWGVMGRGWILEKDFFGRLMPEGGDLVGVVEQRA
jgi:C1A family cysteine protease